MGLCQSGGFHSFVVGYEGLRHSHHGKYYKVVVDPAVGGCANPPLNIGVGGAKPSAPSGYSRQNLVAANGGGSVQVRRDAIEVHQEGHESKRKRERHLRVRCVNCQPGFASNSRSPTCGGKIGDCPHRIRGHAVMVLSTAKHVA